MFKISDFSIAHNVIKTACKAVCCNFSDLEVVIDDPFCFNDEKIYVGKTKTLPETIFNIIYLYLENFHKIHDVEIFCHEKQSKETYYLLMAFLRGLAYKGKMGIESRPLEPVALRLYQFPLPWLIMKLVGASKDIKIDNVKIIAGGSPFVDTVSCEKGEDEDFIFLNTDISYEPCQLACLVCAAIKHHKLDINSVLNDLLETDLCNYIYGLAKLEFEDDKLVQEFFQILKSKSNKDIDYEKLISNFDDIKTAQFGGAALDGFSNSWWFLGLIEQLLEPSRGSDWSTYELLEPLHKELWDKIEKERQKAGKDGVSFESLLRIKDGETELKDVKLIEKNLGSDRIW